MAQVRKLGGHDKVAIFSLLGHLNVCLLYFNNFLKTLSRYPSNLDFLFAHVQALQKPQKKFKLEKQLLYLNSSNSFVLKLCVR